MQSAVQQCYTASVQKQLGMNEALILACLSAGDEATVAEVAQRLAGDSFGRTIDDGSIYMALTRMTSRGYVTARKIPVVSSDGRTRQIGTYMIASAGARALAQFTREAQAIPRLRRLQTQS